MSSGSVMMFVLSSSFPYPSNLAKQPLSSHLPSIENRYDRWEMRRKKLTAHGYIQLPTESTVLDLDLAVAVSQLATKCRIGDYQFCGQAFSRYSGYDMTLHPVNYDFNIIVNGTQALAPTDTDVSNCLDKCK